MSICQPACTLFLDSVKKVWHLGFTLTPYELRYEDYWVLLKLVVSLSEEVGFCGDQGSASSSRRHSIVNTNYCDVNGASGLIIKGSGEHPLCFGNLSKMLT